MACLCVVNLHRIDKGGGEQVLFPLCSNYSFGDELFLDTH